MRVTAETKEATRQTILDVTRDLLRERGWENVSTRDIAAAAEIANGTLFNYFPTKEAIVGAMVAESLATSYAEEEAEGSVEESLFALVARGLRKLRPLRSFLPPAAIGADDRVRDEHLAHAERITGTAFDPVQRHLYWTLYSGVVTFWVADDSPKQEQTLALLDQSMKLFVASLHRSTSHERRSAATSGRDSARRRL